MTSKTNTTITKPALVPKLRFPEFRGSRGWENKVIGPYLEDCSGRVPPDTELPVYSSTREGLKRQDAYFDGRVLQNKNEYGVVPPGCLVYRHMSDDGLFKFNINQTGGDIAVSKEYPVFSTKGLNPVFLLAKLNDGLDFKNFALSQKAGGTRTRLYFSRLCEWRTLLPSLAEQQKIAECLSSMDELMAAQARKVDALKTHKKGLMQQLFPREGETQPRLRFPEFQNAGEWEQKPLGGLCRIRTGKKDANEGAADGAYPFFTCAEKHIYSHNYSFDAEAILIAGNANVGQTSYYTGKFEAYQRTYVLTDFKGIFVPYLYSVLNANLRPDLLAQVQTSAMSYIRLPMLEEYQINAPPSQGEQQRIATCLSSLDALISAETQKHEALKTHKKGLMQQLFPSPEEQNTL